MKNEIGVVQIEKIPVYVKLTAYYDNIGLQFLDFGEQIRILGEKDLELKLYFPHRVEGDKGGAKMIVEGLFKYLFREDRVLIFRNNIVKSKCLDARNAVGTIRDFILENVDYWKDTSKQLYETIRWRYGYNGEDNSVSKIQLHWSEDLKSWFPICDPESRMLDGYAFIDLALSRPRMEREMQLFFKNNNYEPLGHKLIREAMSLVYSNPRSAFLIGMSALEVGVKQFIATLRHDTEWILLNLPSPNIYQIVSEYIPILNNNFSLNQIDLNLLKSAIAIRNKLVHLGKFELSLSDINERLVLVKDIILLFDYMLGNTWSLRYLSPSRMKEFRKKFL